MPYTLKLHKDAEKQLQVIPKRFSESPASTIRSLAKTPRPDGCVQLEKDLYRVTEGNYRIIYAVFDDLILVVVCRVATRSEKTYRDLPGLLRRAQRLAERR